MKLHRARRRYYTRIGKQEDIALFLLPGLSPPISKEKRRKESRKATPIVIGKSGLTELTE
jgi:hypothetical protein